MDAQAVGKDNKIVSLKRVNICDHPREETIIRYFTTHPLGSDPANHCIPIYEVLRPPNQENIIILVMPYLIGVDNVKFTTLGEAVECLQQLFEVCLLTSASRTSILECLIDQGLYFMHRHHVAHW